MGDSYKYSHHLQTPEGIETIYSYIEARGSVDPSVTKTVFFGLQAFVKDYMSEPITMEDVEEAKELVEAHGEPFNYEGWEYIVKTYDGFIPVEIEAVKEGSVVGLSNVLVQIHNTDPKCAWVTSFIETAILRAVWYGTTVSTNSYMIKQDMLEYAKKSGSSMDVSFKLHDFGARGVSSHESAMLGGIAHLVNFMGTDTVEALVGARRLYDEPMAGFSIPAAEHSTITVWGKDMEKEAYRNMLKQFSGKDKMVAIVIDSYDTMNAVKNIFGKDMKMEVIENGGTIILRPDSGDPTQVPIDVIKALMSRFGYTTNKEGFDTLPPYIRVIQGDGINRQSIQQILSNLDKECLTLDNIAFGMGGALLQQINRDTFKFAMKASYAIVKGEGRDVFKDPVTDSGKKSKKGILGLYKVSGEYHTMRKSEAWDGNGKNQLELVYRNGLVFRTQKFSEIRELASQ